MRRWRPRRSRATLGALSIVIALSGCGVSTTPSTSPAATSTLPPAQRSVELSPTPAITGLTGRIVFTRAGGSYGDETTFVANVDGSNEQQLGERQGKPAARGRCPTAP